MEIGHGRSPLRCHYGRWHRLPTVGPQPEPHPQAVLDLLGPRNYVRRRLSSGSNPGGSVQVVCGRGPGSCAVGIRAGAGAAGKRTCWWSVPAQHGAVHRAGGERSCASETGAVMAPCRRPLYRRWGRFCRAIEAAVQAAADDYLVTLASPQPAPHRYGIIQRGLPEPVGDLSLSGRRFNRKAECEPPPQAV